MKPGNFEDIFISKIVRSVQGVGLLKERAQELQKRSIMVEVHGSLSACSVFYNLFHSVLFYSILFCSILFYSILFYSSLFYPILLWDHHTPYFGSCGGPGKAQFFAVHCFCLHGVCLAWTLTNQDFRLPLWNRWELHSSGLLCSE